MQTTGICLGASNVDLVKLAFENGEANIQKHYSRAHEGDVRETLMGLFAENAAFEETRMAVTGKKFKSLVELPSLSEPEAVEHAYRHIQKEHAGIEAIVSAGGETFMVYELDSKGRITDVHTGNKCAAGTGEFFLQQIRRMGLGVDEANEIANIDNPYRVSGRCSVFCKSDCTHALNKGEDKGRIVAGLCAMMGDKIIELLSGCGAENIMLIGGTSKNQIMVEYLNRRLPRLVVPDEACYFEALGAALWASDHGKQTTQARLFNSEDNSFEFLSPLDEYRDQVTFHSLEKEDAESGDRCILGVDVGSTTTKAVIIRHRDNKLLGSVYLRTSGDPVGAARECYSRLIPQLKGKEIQIIGLGVTGSGRQIVGLHALTDAVINEIIAHATAAVHFDPEVDTIFEIGGQDAKYTYITGGVPSDYAMNEACSAGTGSFLEEAAREELDIKMTEIAPTALRGTRPPNFNDQCAAFISSDIKNAIQEGISTADICAGLVYSICMNYSNRVQGNRPTGRKIFMQGGVCYNTAVPLAMAALTGKEISVPPEPGLMGAFGVALVVKDQLEQGLLEETGFDLRELADREVKRHEPFTCMGGGEDCDRKCQISVLEIAGKKHPFGGICSRYDRRFRDTEKNSDQLNLVRRREKLLFEEYGKTQVSDQKPEGRIGLNRSLLTNTLFPLFSTFFTELGYEVVLPEVISEEGIQRQAAAFCYPVEISHGYLNNLLALDTDYIFLPHIKGLQVENENEASVLCPLAQGEPYYLTATWPELKELALTPVLDFRSGYQAAESKFIELGKKLGASGRKTQEAFRSAVNNQKKFHEHLEDIGRETLEKLEEDPDRRAVVTFGRPYNAFAPEANMGIPHKFASQGELIIPLDMLPLADEKPHPKMYWSMGQLIMQGARLVSRHPQLFGLYITNFSCGPDSFLISYFRQEMGRKPSLTLELDSHTADAGLDTRIEAFLDVVESYIQLTEEHESEKTRDEFRPAEIEFRNGEPQVIDSGNRRHSLTDSSVRLLIPSMSETATRSLVAALEYCGVKATACPTPGERELRLGRANSSCKECLPLQLTLGSLLRYLEEHHTNHDEVLVYFMPEASGPCRFGQYNVFMQRLIAEKEIPNIAFLSLTAENSYAGMGTEFTTRAWRALVTADVLGEIQSALLALAEDKKQALSRFQNARNRIFHSLAHFEWGEVREVMAREAETLAEIPLKKPLEEAQKVLLTGEIYVRNDPFSRRFLVKKLAEREIVTLVAPISEWIYYIDDRVQKDLTVTSTTLKERMENRLKSVFKRRIEKEIKKIMTRSGLYRNHPIDIPELISAAEGVISEELNGEAVLTIGGSFSEIIDQVAGVIAVGPFGCMPHRLGEAVITERLSDEKLSQNGDEGLVADVISKFPSLPFLAIETDGNPFPQVIEARLEAFCMQVERLNNYLLERDGIEAE